jgi:hypothetical protein
MGSWCWLGTKIGQNYFETFSGTTRLFFMSAFSSIYLIAITGRNRTAKWRWRRCKIFQTWLCGAEWRPLGSSALIFCVTTWMLNAIFKCWKINCGLSFLSGKTSMNLFSYTTAHRYILRWAFVSDWCRSCRNVGWDDEKITNGREEVKISCPVTFPSGAGQRRDVQGKTPHNEQLKDRIQNVITNTHTHLLQNTVHSILGRMRKMVDPAGVYIEF